MSLSPARLERHLDLLDDLAEIGVALAGQLRNRPRGPKQNVARDYEIISRAVRRAILLCNVLASGAYRPPQPAAARPERDRAAKPPGDRAFSGTTRLDSIDRLDDVSGSFEHIVAAIIRDIQTVVGRLVEPPPKPGRGNRPNRPEADLATLE